MTKEKTLKDLEKVKIKSIDGEIMNDEPLVFVNDLRQEAIKWIKEDKKQIEVDKRMPLSVRILLRFLTKKWMERFDITESELENA